MKKMANLAKNIAETQNSVLDLFNRLDWDIIPIQDNKYWVIFPENDIGMWELLEDSDLV